MSEEPLLPCPFCGFRADIENIEANVVDAVRKSAGCTREGCQGYQSTLTFSTRKEAIAAWNNRAIKPIERKMIESDGRHRLSKALEIMTDEWIDNGKETSQTVIDMRDILKFVLKTITPKP